MVFQSGALFDSLTVAENIAFPLETRTDMTEEQKDARVAELAEMLEVTDVVDQLPRNSALARNALSHRPRAGAGPEAILFDEPTTMVDRHGAHTGDLILRLKEKFHKRRSSSPTIRTWRKSWPTASYSSTRAASPTSALGGFEASPDPFLRNFRRQDELIPAGRDGLSGTTQSPSDVKQQLRRVMVSGCAAFLHRDGARAAMVAAAARNGHPRSACGFLQRSVFRADSVCGRRTLDAVPEEGGFMFGRKWRSAIFTASSPGGRIDLHGFLFPWIVARQRGHDGLRGRRGNRVDGGEPHISAGGLVCDAVCRRVSEHHRLAHRQVAAERGGVAHTFR